MTAGIETNKAVFLSYASEDAQAALRICSGLRQAGIEVWFDQSELRGGDAWDASIRRQIKSCALFALGPGVGESCPLSHRQSRLCGGARCLSGSWMRPRKRTYCSSSVIENQYFSSLIPERTSMRSNSGTER